MAFLDREWAADGAVGLVLPATHPFGRAQCKDPILDALSFVECAVHLSRVALASGATPGHQVLFNAALDDYTSGCTSAPAAWLSGDCMESCSRCAIRQTHAEELEAPPAADTQPADAGGWRRTISPLWCNVR